MRAANAFAGWQWFDFVIIIICINSATWRDLHAVHFNDVHKTCVCVVCTLCVSKTKYKNRKTKFILFHLFCFAHNKQLAAFFPYWFILSFGIRKNQQYARFMYLLAIYLQTKHYRWVFCRSIPILQSTCCQVREWAKKHTTTRKCVSFFHFKLHALHNSLLLLLLSV